MKIIVECYSDEFLIRTMGIPKKIIEHQGGKGKVMARVKYYTQAIGMVDEDPYKSSPKDMENYRKIKSFEDTDIYKRNNDDNKTLIVLKPDLEGWLLKRAKKSRISITKYEIPDNVEWLHRPHICRERNFKDFVKEVVNKDDEAKIITKWIKEAIS